MRQLSPHLALGILISAAALTCTMAFLVSAASVLYYCPDRKADQQYSATKWPDCIPLIEPQESPTDSTVGTSQREFKMENLQKEVAGFLDRYRLFLECCKSDLNELRKVEQLGDEVNQLLSYTQAHLSNYSLASRGIMLRELIPPVAKARGDLKSLRARLEQINDISIRLDTLNFEEAGRESQRIRDLKESIERDIRAPKLPGSAKTGVEIGVAPAVGPAIGRSPKTGTDIGREGLTGQDIGTSPRSSRDIGSSGSTGFEIGPTGRAGPEIGESPLNQETSSSVNSTLQRSTVGSSISDSTIGSSLNSSTIGSSMQDSTVDSTVGSSLPNR